MKCLCEAGASTVTPKEISQLFKDARMRSPTNQKSIRCGAFKVKEYLVSISRDSYDSNISVTPTESEAFKIAIEEK